MLAPAAAGQSAVDQYVPRLDKGGAADNASPTEGTGVASPAGEDGGGPQGRSAPIAQETLDKGQASGGSAGGFPLTPFVAVLGAVVLLLLAARTARPLISRLGFIRSR